MARVMGTDAPTSQAAESAQQMQESADQAQFLQRQSHQAMLTIDAANKAGSVDQKLA
jgi:hypothetical protein